MKVSNICLGTMTFGEQNSKKDSLKIMDFAFEKGINFFDTAEMYPTYPRKETQGDWRELLVIGLKEKIDKKLS